MNTLFQKLKAAAMWILTSAVALVATLLVLHKLREKTPEPPPAHPPPAKPETEGAVHGAEVKAAGEIAAAGATAEAKVAALDATAGVSDEAARLKQLADQANNS